MIFFFYSLQKKGGTALALKIEISFLQTFFFPNLRTFFGIGFAAGIIVSCFLLSGLINMSRYDFH